MTSKTQRDGNWYPMSPGQKIVTRKVYANYTRKGVWYGRVTRFNLDTRHWDHEHCPHAHDKQSAARKCGEAAAKRLNRAAAKAASMAGHTDDCEMMVRLLSGERCTCGFDA